MIETTETPEDVEKLLAEARANLQAFEDGVDRKRLLERLRTQSPMHPVLLFRALFLALALLLSISTLAVMVVPLLSADLARSMVKFEAIVPAPPGIPGLPALLGVLVLCMAVAWLMATLAAYAMGRDAQMLPWEQKQHQKLVNEVTRLTTQKAVMERIRGTPAGARPRIATPVPMSMRDRAGLATPPGIGRAGLGGSSGQYGTPGGLGATPPGVGRSNPSHGGGVPGRFGPPPGATPAPAPSGGLAPAGPAGGSSVLARARSGGGQGPGAARGGLGGTPPGVGAGGFGRPPSNDRAPERSPLGAAPRAGRGLGAQPSASSRKQRLAPPMGFPGTPNPAERTTSPSSSASSSGGGLFGTPPPAQPSRPEPVNGASSGGLLSKARSGGSRDDLEVTSPYLRGPRESDTRPAAGSERLNKQQFPRWGRIDEPWLEEAIQRAEQVAGTFPEQAHLEFSQETHLPFTLVIARATPAMAVRAMVGYVEFLASVLTPPRGRIELKNVPHLDSSFHRNVSAALEPYFGDRFEVEPEIGRVEIIFKDPDPSWQDVPVLPME